MFLKAAIQVMGDTAARVIAFGYYNHPTEVTDAEHLFNNKDRVGRVPERVKSCTTRYVLSCNAGQP